MSDTPVTPTRRLNGNDRVPPPWLIYLLGGAGLLGVGGGGGSFLTGSSVQTALQASETKIVGKLDLLSLKVDKQAEESERTRAAVEALAERVRKLELDAARGGGPR